MATDVKEKVPEESTEVETSASESNTETLKNLNSEQYKEWRTSGKLPDKPASKEAKPAESKTPDEEEEEPETSEEVEEDKEEVEDKTPKPSKKQSRSEIRKAELNEEIRTLATKRQEEEKALADILEKKKKAAEPEVKPEKEPEEKPKAFSIKDLVVKIKARADKGEFESYEEVIAATAEALVEEKGVISETKLQKILKDTMDEFRKTWAKEQEDDRQKSAVEIQRKAQENEWVKKVNEAEKDHPDFKAKCFHKESPASRILSGSPLDRAIMKSPFGAKLLYHCCTTEGEVDRLNALDADLDQPAEIKAIITKLSGEKIDEEEKEAPVIPTTRSKKPPSEASGRSSAVDDPSEKALKNKDYLGYAAAENAKERAKRKAELGK